MIFKNSIVKAICFCLILSFQTFSSGNTKDCAFEIMTPIKPNLPEGLKFNLLSLNDCRRELFLNDSLFFVAARNSKKDTKKVYGLRLYLVEILNRKAIIRFESHPNYDSYLLRPTVFTSKNCNDYKIVLVETATEYSWGNSVYLFEDMTMTKIGEIEALVEDDENGSNAAPYTKIKRVNGKLIFTFTKDVFLSKDNGGSYYRISKDSIKYVYNGKNSKLKLIESK